MLGNLLEAPNKYPGNFVGKPQGVSLCLMNQPDQLWLPTKAIPKRSPAALLYRGYCYPNSAIEIPGVAATTVMGTGERSQSNRILTDPPVFSADCLQNGSKESDA